MLVAWCSIALVKVLTHIKASRARSRHGGVYKEEARVACCLMFNLFRACSRSFWCYNEAPDQLHRSLNDRCMSCAKPIKEAAEGIKQASFSPALDAGSRKLKTTRLGCRWSATHSYGLHSSKVSKSRLPFSASLLMWSSSLPSTEVHMLQWP